MTDGRSASAQPDQAAPSHSHTLPRKWMSLRTKGLLAFAVLILYATVVGAIVFRQKDQVLNRVAELQQIYKLEEITSRVMTAVFHSVVTVNDSIFQRDSVFQRETDFREIELVYHLLQVSYNELIAAMPDAAPNFAPLNQAFVRARDDPAQPHLIALAQELKMIVPRLTKLISHLGERETALSQEYRMSSDSVVMTALVLGLVGMVLFGAVISLFFTHLTADIHFLQNRATDIVKGYRGAPMPITRHDEVGRLMEAVNQMEADLEEHERQRAIERQKYFHQEKMAAVGSLAAGVAHEIGNPIAAISGIAQAIQESCQTFPPDGSCQEQILSQISLMQSQISRLAGITREISDFATPRAAERELLDLNGLVRTTVGLVGYDQRFRHIELKLELDHQLPAVYGVGDQIIQVLMNLLINAAGALERVHDRPHRIAVTTSLAGRQVCVAVEDNGCGMDELTLQRATDAFFTTKPAGRGTGLGLALCKSIADAHSGSLEIASQPDAGTAVRLLLPIPEEQRMG